MKNLVKVMAVVAMVTFASCSKENVSNDVYEVSDRSTGTTYETSPVHLSYGETPQDAYKNWDEGRIFIFFVPKGETFENTNALLSNEEGTVFTKENYYSVDGTYSKLWMGNSFQRGIRHLNQ